MTVMEELLIDEKDNILVIAPHPDDESIGCGGVLLSYPSHCTVVVVTDGSKGSRGEKLSKEADIRKKQFDAAMKVCNVNKVIYLGLPDGEMFDHHDCFRDISFKQYTKIFIPSVIDNHPDHMAVAKCALEEITKQCGDEFDKHMLFQYEVHSTLAEPSHYLNITDVIDEKIKMINCHRDQCMFMPYSDMARKMAELRALQAGMKDEYLETFTLIKDNVIDNNIFEREIKIQKQKLIIFILSRWLENKILKKSYINTVKSSGIRRVSIYGGAIVGKLLFCELEQNGIEVVDVFDRREINLYGRVSKSVKNGDKSVDAVFISVVQSTSSIEKELIENGYKKTITIFNLIEEMQ